MVIELFKKYKYVLIVLGAGLVLLLTMRDSGVQARASPFAASDSESKLAATLSQISGAGEVSVALSDKGVIVVCESTAPDVKLKITQAVSVYTGLSSEKIVILKKEVGR